MMTLRIFRFLCGLQKIPCQQKWCKPVVLAEGEVLQSEAKLVYMASSSAARGA